MNKRKEDSGEGGEIELEITEIKSKKIKLEVKEEEEGKIGKKIGIHFSGEFNFFFEKFDFDFLLPNFF